VLFRSGGILLNQIEKRKHNKSLEHSALIVK
jgi:hypothetical protein